jgi:hypothetical protein
MIIEVLKEKNEHLEEENGLVAERNGFLEDTLANQRKETGVIFEENCALKLKLIELQKHTSQQNEGDDQGDSGLNQLFSEEYEKVVGENSRLLSDMDSFRKTIHSLRQENKLLFAQVTMNSNRSKNSNLEATDEVCLN